MCPEWFCGWHICCHVVVGLSARLVRGTFSAHTMTMWCVLAGLSVVRHTARAAGEVSSEHDTARLVTSCFVGVPTLVDSAGGRVVCVQCVARHHDDDTLWWCDISQVHAWRMQHTGMHGTISHV